MNKQDAFYNTVNSLAQDGINRGILQLFTEDIKIDSSLFSIGGKSNVVNFGSCSYLGLEFDPRIKAAAKEAIDNYGTQFSAARIYVSSRHYRELEELMCEIFNAPTLVAPTTTLAHIATIPVILESGDAVILDHQVHNTVQNATNLLKPRGVHIELMRHNNMDWLEDRIKLLRQKYNRVWYMADGIYSMYGDKVPVEKVYELLDKYPEFYFYNDDAHGMSCFGKHGRGSTLNGRDIHPKMILATSFAKAFATGGAAIVFPNQKWASKVRNTGGPFLSSGPLQPASVAAALASAKIHLTDEIYQLQKELQDKIRFTNDMLKKYNLPSVSVNDTPIFFVGVSLPKVGFNMIQRLLNDGFYTNIGIFPTVPMKNTGIRFTITRLNTYEQIEGLIKSMAYHYPLALKEEGFTIENVYKAFKMSPPNLMHELKKESQITEKHDLNIHHYSSIHEIDRTKWNSLLGNKGMLDWDGLNFLETVFTNNELPEDNWAFDYIIIEDKEKRPVLATFFTSTIAKDDMLSAAEISYEIEQERNIQGKYYLTSNLLCMGSLLTEGDHLFLDKTSGYWKRALKLMFDKIGELQEKYNISVTNLRDYMTDDPEMDTLFLDNGYFKTELPENHVYKKMTWNNIDEYVDTLSAKKRRHVRSNILKYQKNYFRKIRSINELDEKELKHLYQLYLNVKQKSYGLNTFDLPYKLFKTMAAFNKWEVITLHLKEEVCDHQQAVAFFFGYQGYKSYNPVIVGIDYTYNETYKCYRQSLFQAIYRARELSCEELRFGYSATIEKQKLGAETIQPIAYLQVKDHFNLEVINAFSGKTITTQKEMIRNNRTL